MTDDPYEISMSGEVISEIHRLGRLAQNEDRFQSFANAMLWIEEELKRTPAEFGESREEVGSLAFRCGFAGPVYVEYAIKENERVVFIRRFVLLRNS